MALIPAEIFEEGIEDIVCQAFTASSGVTINAGGFANSVIPNITKTGYTPLLAIYAYNNKTNSIYPSTVSGKVNSSNQVTFALFNGGSAQQTEVKATAHVIFVKAKS